VKLQRLKLSVFAFVYFIFDETLTKG